MKFSKKIIGLALAFMMTLNLGMPLSYAETEPEIDCKAKKPNYETLMKLWSEAKVKDQKAYQDAYDKAQLAHHDYVGCIFNFAVKEILKSDGIDWMSPDQACLTGPELKKVIQKSDPDQMLEPVLNAHTKYRDFLQALGSQFDGTGVITDEDGKPLKMLDALSAKSANIGTLTRQRELEIQNSLIAIDLMFTSLKELRLSFVMHVHFQCALKFLDKYRRSLEDLRKVIEPLPGQLEDCSMS